MSADLVLRKPITGSALCCARAGSEPENGQASDETAAAPPSSLMNSRRRIASIALLHSLRAGTTNAGNRQRAAARAVGRIVSLQRGALPSP